MRKRFGIILLAGMLAMALSGCKYDIKLMEDETEKITEATTETTTEVMTESVEEETTTAKDEYTDTMSMLLEKQEGDWESEYLDRIYLGDELMVAFPKNGTEQSGKGTFSAEKDGIYIEFELNPYERSGKQYVPVNDSLDKLVDNFYGDGSLAADDMEKGSAEAISDDTARATVSFIDVSEDKACACDTTMYLIDLDDENTVSIRLIIDYANVSSKTEDIIAALEDYYEVDILYDKAAAGEKLAAYNKNSTVSSGTGGSSSSKVQTVAWNGYEFEIPANWKKDSANSRSEGVFYAPNGSIDRAGYGIILATTRGTTATVDTYVNNQSEMNQMFSELTGGMVNSVTFSDAGQTFLGHTLKIQFTMKVDGVSLTGIVYSNVSTSKMEMIGAYGITGNTSNAESVLQEIMNNGRKK